MIFFRAKYLLKTAKCSFFSFFLYPYKKLLEPFFTTCKITFAIFLTKKQSYIMCNSLFYYNLLLENHFYYNLLLENHVPHILQDHWWYECLRMLFWIVGFLSKQKFPWFSLIYFYYFTLRTYSILHYVIWFGHSWTVAL